MALSNIFFRYRIYSPLTHLRRSPFQRNRFTYITFNRFSYGFFGFDIIKCDKSFSRFFSVFLLLIVFSGFSLSGNDHQEKKLRATTHFHRSFRRFFPLSKQWVLHYVAAILDYILLLVYQILLYWNEGENFSQYPLCY